MLERERERDVQCKRFAILVVVFCKIIVVLVEVTLDFGA